MSKTKDSPEVIDLVSSDDKSSKKERSSFRSVNTRKKRKIIRSKNSADRSTSDNLSFHTTDDNKSVVSSSSSSSSSSSHNIKKNITKKKKNNRSSNDKNERFSKKNNSSNLEVIDLVGSDEPDLIRTEKMSHHSKSDSSKSISKERNRRTKKQNWNINQGSSNEKLNKYNYLDDNDDNVKYTSDSSENDMTFQGLDEYLKYRLAKLKAKEKFVTFRRHGEDFQGRLSYQPNQEFVELENVFQTSGDSPRFSYNSLKVKESDLTEIGEPQTISSLHEYINLQPIQILNEKKRNHGILKNDIVTFRSETPIHDIDHYLKGKVVKVFRDTNTAYVSVFDEFLSISLHYKKHYEVPINLLMKPKHEFHIVNKDNIADYHSNRFGIDPWIIMIEEKRDLLSDKFTDSVWKYIFFEFPVDNKANTLQIDYNTAASQEKLFGHIPITRDSKFSSKLYFFINGEISELPKNNFRVPWDKQPRTYDPDFNYYDDPFISKRKIEKFLKEVITKNKKTLKHKAKES